ncbi:MAG: double-strand break repair protein AddB [Bdellovibrionales bacterium]
MTKTVYTIPPDEKFCSRLAEGLWKQAEEDPFRLSEMLVLMPNRRSCRYLREAFPHVTGNRSALLPRMRPVGELDESELYFTGGDFNPDIPPALSPLRRQLLLTRLIRQRDKDMPLDQAALLAKALGLLINEVQIERKDFSGLAGLVGGNLAKHWELTVEFLGIVTDSWPAILAEEGAIDPEMHRSLVIDAQAETWRKVPTDYPVIVAGTMGSIEATRDLMEVVAAMPQGAIVLPGLDRKLDEEAWQAIEESHPQYTMKKLLEKFGMRRAEVRTWPACKDGRPPRLKLLREAMRPAETAEAWRRLDSKSIPRKALDGLSRLTCDSAQEEAQAISLIMRAALEEPRKTVALVTLDRELAERVGAQLARWQIEINDSAGIPLGSLPVGGFLMDVLAAARPGATPIDYLALLKHPFTACGIGPAQCRAKAREAEVKVWRNPDGHDETDKEPVRAWIASFLEMLRPLADSWRKPMALAERIELHRMLAEQLASDGETGARRLWQGQAGEEASAWLAEWQKAAGNFPAVNGDDYTNLFTSMVKTQVIRPNYGQHPRLSILGPLEARLLETDLVILGGMNEGSWPPETNVDPWMSRPMKTKFGLGLPEQRIGFAAHDFAQLAAAPEVVITRARRAGNAPTVPSRFVLQLEAVLQALGYSDKKTDALATRQPWIEWARGMDKPGRITPCPPPAPRPPASARPTCLNVTDIGTWRRNPYAIYARHVLKLRKLQPLEIEATVAEKGIIIHAALEKFLRTYRERLPPRALDALLTSGREVFAPYMDQPQVVAFWWPRFERIAEWFIEKEWERRAEGVRNVRSEASGSLTLPNGFTIRGRADRIDSLPEGTLAIIDYKTGAAPRTADVRSGYEPQLSLLALIAREGGFTDIVKAPAAELEYWKLTGGSKAGEVLPVREAVDTLVDAARHGLEALVAEFANEATPYQAVPKPNMQPRYDDYAHLARLAEWGRTTEDA